MMLVKIVHVLPRDEVDFAVPVFVQWRKAFILSHLRLSQSWKIFFYNLTIHSIIIWQRYKK